MNLIVSEVLKKIVNLSRNLKKQNDDNKYHYDPDLDHLCNLISSFIKLSIKHGDLPPIWKIEDLKKKYLLGKD